MIDKLFNKVKNFIKRCIISETSDDSNIYAIAKIKYYDKDSIAEAIYPYGMSANAPVDTVCILFNINGHESNRACIPYAIIDRFKNLKSGEVIFGSPATQSYVKFMTNGDIEIDGTKTIFKKGTFTIEEEATIDCTKINLGSGGNEIARKGDQIKVNVGGTDYIGTIITGGTNTSI